MCCFLQFAVVVFPDDTNLLIVLVATCQRLSELRKLKTDVLLSAYLCFIEFLYLYLYVIGGDTWIG